MLPGIGVVGTGIIAQYLVPLLKRTGFNIIGIWGPTEQDAKETAEWLDIPFHTSKIDLLLLNQEVGLLFVICAPHHQAEISVKALGIGKHVVCERPGGINQIEAVKMVNAAQYYPALISLVNYSMRYLPAVQKMKNLISEKYLGEGATLCDIRVNLPSMETDYWATTDQRMGGGFLNLVGSHYIDLLHFVTGLKAKRVHGVLRQVNSGQEECFHPLCIPDYVNFQLEIPNTNASLVLTANITILSSNVYKSNTYIHEIIMCGESGRLVLDKDGNLRGQDKRVSEESLAPETILWTETQLKDRTKFNDIPSQYLMGLDIFAGILHRKFNNTSSDSGASFQDSQYVQAVLEAIHRSQETKSWELVQIQ